MKLYRTKFFDAEPDVGNAGTRYLWSGTQADARADRKSLKEDGHSDIETEEIDVPTSKAELLEFLNEHCTHVPGE